MLIALDVHYRTAPSTAVVACVGFGAWEDAEPALERRLETQVAGEYQPGRFYQRELPALLAMLETLPDRPEVIVLDGFVWLGDHAHPGLGGHLYRALGDSLAVVGVAKNPYAGAGPLREILRGNSEKPLFVSSAGFDLEEAAQRVRSMHGPHRIPTLLRRVDQVSRR